MADFILSLPTCNRCQKRKKKCDNLLPNCTTCNDDGVECIIHDHGLKQDIPRQYIGALNQRVIQLSTEVSRLEQSGSSGLDVPSTSTSLPNVFDFQTPLVATPTSNAPPTVSTANAHDVPYQTSFFVSDEIVTTFVGPKSASNFGLAAATTATNVANCNGRSFLLDPSVHVQKPLRNFLAPEKLDKSIIEHTAVRDLLENYYFPIIHPRCPVVDPSQVVLDTHLRRLPIKRRFFVVMTVAIAAAHQGRTYPGIYTSALILRHWADELIDAVLMEHEGDSLQALLLLIVYELVDPSRKLIWTLLGVACRMCVKLGWHRSSETEYDARLINDQHQEEGESQSSYPLPWRRRMFRILYQWERAVCHALGRPTILPDDFLFTSPLDKHIGVLQIQSQLHQKICEPPLHDCIITPELVAFVHENLDASKDHDASWLSLYPITRHVCDKCVGNGWWANQLGSKIEKAATSIIHEAFDSHRKGQVLSVWLTTLELFSAGMVLVDMELSRKLDNPQENSNPTLGLFWNLGRCSSVLAGFAELWPGARVYRDVFDGLANHTMT